MVPPLLTWRTMRNRLLATLLLVGCADPATTPPPPLPPDPLPPTVVFLSPADHLSRASMALRGVRPTIEQLRAVADDPTMLPLIVDGYLTSPEFGKTIRELHNETLLVRVEQANMTYPAVAPLTGVTSRQMNDAVFEEPLALIEDIVMTDQPYTAIVTADYTMANGITAQVWGMSHAGAPEAWERSNYPDNRAAAGILATSAMQHRWRSTGFNYNRGRANEISRALLCHDFLDSEIQIDTSVDLSDPEVVANAVQANSSCAGCHQTLDPLASYLFTFRGNLNPGQVDAYPISYFTPGQADSWMTKNQREPMFFGAEATGLGGLGQAIADDPRFATCAARRFASYFTEVGLNDVSNLWVARLRQAFVDSEYDAKTLAKEIVLSDEFRISHDTDAARAETTVGVLKARPEQMHRMLVDLTGFEWSTSSTQRLRMPYGEANLLESDFIGFRVLAGGIDSFFVTSPVHTMNATSSLVAKTAAAAAAEFVVEHDLAAPAGERTLFVEAGVNVADDAKIKQQLAYLHARIYGELVLPDSAEVAETFAMYTDALAASSDRSKAWKVTLIGMLSNFRSLFY